MKKYLWLLGFVFIFMLVGCGSNNGDKAHIDMSERLITISQNATIEDIARDAVYAVVSIETSSSIGSGVCVASGGYVLTNSHVVNGENDITLHLFDGSTILADIVYEDVVLDVAILKTSVSMPYLPLANSDDVNVGQDVLAVGTPLSLSLNHSFTKGIISALNRTIPISGANGMYFMNNLIQHDASLNSGNSGGPLLNTKGEVIGINTLKVTDGDGVGFSIPTKAFMSILNSVIGSSDFALPYLGILGYDASIEKDLSLEGFYVLDVLDYSPVSDHIEDGAVITKINGVNVENYLDFRNELYKCKAFDKIAITYVLDGVENDVIVLLGKK